MPDKVLAPPPSANGKRFAPHPTTAEEGPIPFACVDVIDLGEVVEEYPGKPVRLVHKIALVFASGLTNPDNDGKLYTVQQEFTLSTYETAKLRLFIEAWYGRKFTDEQLANGFALEKLVGATARPVLLGINHKTSRNGRQYAIISSTGPVPKPMLSMIDVAAILDSYTRDDYWEEKKAANRKAALEFGAKSKPAPEGDFPDFPAALEDEEDDLPF